MASNSENIPNTIDPMPTTNPAITKKLFVAVFDLKNVLKLLTVNSDMNALKLQGLFYTVTKTTAY